MSSNIKICELCNEKVLKFNNNSSFMEVNKNFYHYDCVVKYNYHKFCRKALKYKKNEEINNI